MRQMRQKGPEERLEEAGISGVRQNRVAQNSCSGSRSDPSREFGENMRSGYSMRNGVQSANSSTAKVPCGFQEKWWDPRNSRDFVAEAGSVTAADGTICRPRLRCSPRPKNPVEKVCELAGYDSCSEFSGGGVSPC